MTTTSSTTTVSPPNPTTLLAHLISRPSVLSTLILSRKNGSIIRCTGQLATLSPDVPSSTPPLSPPLGPAGTPPPSERPSNTDPPSSTPPHPTPAQTLARLIFDYVSTASALASSVHALDDAEEGAFNAPSSLSRRLAAAKLSGGTDGSGSADTDGAGGSGEDIEGDEEREIKLLRLRTKGREVVVVVEREWLLVVVNDVKGGEGKVG